MNLPVALLLILIAILAFAGYTIAAAVVTVMFFMVACLAAS